MHPKICGIICARTGSSRLPGKVLKLLAGKPVLEHIVERLRNSKRLNDLVIATTTLAEDDGIELLCKKLGISCYRGSSEDVLGRLLGALQSKGADIGVEVYGDGPFTEAELVDQFIDFFLNNKYDFVSNDLKTSFPPGLEIEVYRTSALEDSSMRTADPSIREHGTLFIRQNPKLYNSHNVDAPPNYRHPDHYLEVDTQEDFDVVSAIYDQLYQEGKYFSALEAIQFLKSNPNIAKRNQDVARRWKAYRE